MRQQREPTLMDQLDVEREDHEFTRAVRRNRIIADQLYQLFMVLICTLALAVVLTAWRWTGLIYRWWS